MRLVLAAALGSVIGFERERLAWAAGLRTPMPVGVGSTLVMSVSAFGFADVLGSRDHIVLDPSRIAAQVLSGIGFLGAGTTRCASRSAACRISNAVRSATSCAGCRA
nr:MgtC/SapB family protein [Burkholderia sp. Bp9142]